jgi:hypothetical protein
LLLPALTSLTATGQSPPKHVSTNHKVFLRYFNLLDHPLVQPCTDLPAATAAAAASAAGKLVQCNSSSSSSTSASPEAHQRT